MSFASARLWLLVIHPAVLLGLITAAAAFFRFYGLDWGIPYHHFQADEYLALSGSDQLRHNPKVAAESAKFFIYPVLPKELHGMLVGLYEGIRHPLDLRTRADQETLIMLGRLISALLGTATVLAVYAGARRMAGATAGLIGAALMAASVEHIRVSHFFTSDISLVFFCALALAAFIAIADSGRPRAYVAAGLATGAALSCKYSAGFLLLPLLIAHLVAPGRPHARDGWRAWAAWTGRGAAALLIATTVFLATNPLIFDYPAKFVQDVYDGVVTPNFSDSGPIWTRQFADVPSLWLYWFTNLLPWGLGPAFAITSLLGVGWAAWRGGRMGWTLAAFVLAYYAIAAQTTTPYIRYILPMTPGLAVAAGVFCQALLRWRSAGPGPAATEANTTRWPRLAPTMATMAVGLVIAGTWLWAIAYMNVYAQEDTRLQAAAFIEQRIPRASHVLVEPSQNTPPMGSYYTAPLFYQDYVGWGPHTIREDYFSLYTLDVYASMYYQAVSPEAKRRYIAGRLASVDYIVMDDTFLEFYEHLHGSEHAPVREYYADLFAGRLDFRLLREFHVRPSLFGWDIHDESAEMTFTLFDHPQIYIFIRKPGTTRVPPPPPRAAAGSAAAPAAGR